MSNAKAKTIKLLLKDGDLGGVIRMQDSSWNSGELYSAPRNSAKVLAESKECKNAGVYLLLSNNMVYVGQSSALSRRINQHIVGKEWWERIVVLTTNNNSLNHAAIDYLESNLIEKANRINHLDCENKVRGNESGIDEFDKTVLDQYLEEALFLMELIGIKVFNEEKGKERRSCLIDSVDTNTALAIGKRAKKEALQYLKDHAVQLHTGHKDITYAIKQPNKDEFWANPNINVLDREWEIVLNNNMKKELTLIRVPEKTFKLKKSNMTGLYVRSDKPERIDLNINASTFTDRRSKFDFGKYIVKTVKY